MTRLPQFVYFRLWALVGLGLLLLMVMGCTPRVFGVPEERWQELTEEQRTEAIRGYNEREYLRQQQSLARQEEAAAEAQRRALQEEQEAQRRRERVEAIYSGQERLPGDLLRVTLKDGQLKYNGKHVSYVPTSFLIADGEQKEVEIRVAEGDRKRHLTLWVGYLEGNLDIDIGPDGRNQGQALRMTYERDWERGTTYRDLSWSKNAPLQGRHVSITVLAVQDNGRSSHQR